MSTVIIFDSFCQRIQSMEEKCLKKTSGRKKIGEWYVPDF
jgi:hypothetical protein